MFCGNCGHQIPDNSQFCPELRRKCGCSSEDSPLHKEGKVLLNRILIRIPTSSSRIRHTIRIPRRI